MVYLHDGSSDYFVFDQWLHDDLKLDFPELFYFSYQFFYYGESSIIFATCKSKLIRFFPQKAALSTHTCLN